MPVHLHWMRISVAGILLTARLPAPAQNWQTVDDFAVAGTNAEAHGVAIDAAGRIYVVGTANGHAIVRSSDDGGSSWITLDDFLYAPGTNDNRFNAITIDPQGVLFVGGVSGFNPSHWIIRRSADQGVTWQIVDDYYTPRNGPEPGTNGAVYSLSNDGHGRVYGAGSFLRTGPSYPYWMVRGSVGGTSWDTKLLLFAGYGQLSQLTCAGQDIYVTGTTSDSETTMGYIVRSGDYGATWTTNFAGTNEAYYTINRDSAGNVYCAGNRGLHSSSVDWVVRKAAPGGTNWTILDSSTYQDTSGSGVVSYPQPRSMAIDTAGNISVAGQFLYRGVTYLTNGAAYWGYQTWFTRQYSVPSGRWRTTDLFSYSTNPTNSQDSALGTAMAPDGNTFVVGYGTSDSGQRHWIVRKRATPGPPPHLQIALADGSVSVSWPVSSTSCNLEWTDSTDVTQPWHACADTVKVIADRNTVNFPISSGVRLFRLKSTAGE